jgi:hypothetical protein
MSVALHVATLAALSLWMAPSAEQPGTGGNATVVTLELARVETDDGVLSRSFTERRVRPDVGNRPDVADGTAAAVEPEAARPIGEKSPDPPDRTADDGDRRDPQDRARTDTRVIAASSPPPPPSTDGEIERSPARTVAAEGRHPDAEQDRTDETRVRISRRQMQVLDRLVRQLSDSLADSPRRESYLTWRHDGRDYRASVSRVPVDDETGLDRILVEVSFEEGGTTYSTAFEMKRLAFSSYAHFVNRWAPHVYIHDDEYDGRFHSNGEMNLHLGGDAMPRFNGRVTTAARSVNLAGDRELSEDQVFRGGLETGVRPIRLPRRIDRLPTRSGAEEDRVHFFDEDSRIRFYADGTYGWQSTSEGSVEQRAECSHGTSFLVAAESVRLHVSGTVNGKILVYSPERIVVEGNLVYAEDPHETPGSDDYLGLVSDRSVEIAGPGITGDGDLVIQAAIYAKHSFTVRRSRATSGGLLRIYGSLTTNTMSATEPRFATMIQYDPRLERARPPRFPMTNHYELESWDRVWTTRRF